MKLSDYFTNILSAIFMSNSTKEREDIFKSIIKNKDDMIRIHEDLTHAYDKTIKDFNISYNTLYKKYSEVIRENHRLNEINTVLNNKLERYYKTGKNIKKK